MVSLQLFTRHDIHLSVGILDGSAAFFRCRASVREPVPVLEDHVSHSFRNLDDMLDVAHAELRMAEKASFEAEVKTEDGVCQHVHVKLGACNSHRAKLYQT